MKNPVTGSNFIEELKRRNVFRVAAAYIVSSWLIIQVVTTIAPVMGIPDSVQRLVLGALLIGFPVSLILAWVYELGPGGLQKDRGAPHPEISSKPSIKGSVAGGVTSRRIP